MSLNFLLHQDGRWISFDETRVETLDSRPHITGASVVVTDFEGAVSDVIALEGSPTHAVALIERRLRADGLVDGECKILLHQVRTVGNGYQALFTAVPLERWQQMFTWAEQQNDHCLLVPVVGLLWRLLKPGSGLVLHSGRQVLFLASLRKGIVFRSALAFSDSREDLAMTVAALGERVGRDLSTGDAAIEPLSIDWVNALVREPGGRAFEAAAGPLDNHLIEVFAANSGTTVALAAQESFRDEAGAAYRSALPRRARPALVGAAVNSPGARAMHFAERVLPWVSAVSLVLALGLSVLGGRWTLAAAEASSRAEALQAEIDELDAQIVALVPKQQEIPASYAEVLGFINRASGLSAALDPPAVLATLRQAAGDDVRVLRVRLDADRGAAQALRVDGMVKHAPQSAPHGQQVARFVQRLREAGYVTTAIDPEAAGGRGGSPGGLFSYQLTHAPAAVESEAMP